MKKIDLKTNFSTFVESFGSSGLHIVIKDSFGRTKVFTFTSHELFKIDFENAIEYLKKEQNKAADFTL